jgi:putative radical SAM enzyme (TIGR03279 family)
MPLPQVVAVADQSPASRAGLLPGDEIRSMNGQVPRDVIEYQLIADEPLVELEVARGGLDLSLVVEKHPGEPLGAEVSSAVFDRVRTCDNHCEFCFIYQLPKGMRRSLYLKDDDFRLSFLYGNFTTLTRFTEADLERVVTERLSPLYVSIHATDPELRAHMLRNRRGAVSLRWLRLLLDAGIEVHGQVVVCPGLNDGGALEDTLAGLLDEYPELATAAVVPLGVSRYSNEEAMRPHSRGEAAAVLDSVEHWQGVFLRALGHRLVYAADEYYLLAGREFPRAERYDGFPQHENGIGMARAFELEFAGRKRPDVPASGFFQWVEGAPAEGYRAPRAAVPPLTPLTLAPPRSATGTSLTGNGATPAVDRPSEPVTIVTGEYGAAVLRPLLDRSGYADVDLLAVKNEFFGGNIAVTGLITGADVSSALARSPHDRRYLLPDVCLSKGVFLDQVRVGDLPRDVEVVPADGAALRGALARRRQPAVAGR